MPIIDLLNHHLDAAGFQSSQEAGLDKGLALLNSKPVPGSDECFFRYNKNDALRSYLSYGFLDDSVRFVRSVATDPQAIGYETLWMVRDHTAAGAVKVLRLNGVSPEDAPALAQGRYPLYRVYNVTTWEGAAGKPLAKKLVRYLLDRVEESNSQFFMVPVTRLRDNGWKFEGDELVGGPE